MKKPYIKKFSEIADFTFWIVDGNYIRSNFNGEFTNYGNHYMFKFIPKKEFWIDKERKEGEEKYYINSMLIIHKLMSKKVKYDEALKRADIIEKKERTKSKIIRKEMKLTKNHDKLIKSVHKKLLKKYSKKVKVWIVNGEIVRGLFFVDFTEGGHDKVYHLWINIKRKPSTIW